MSGMQVMMAVRSGVIRREGRTRLMIRKGVTTAHAGSEIVRDHPHLWEPLEVTFPSGDVVSAAVDDARLSHTQALRDLYAGLVERGYDIEQGTAAEDVPAQVVALAFSAIDHPRGGRGVELGEGEPGDVVTSGAGRPYLVGVNDGGWKTYTPVDGGDPEPAAGDADDADPGETGGAGTMPDDVVDPSTKEGRAEIRAWAEEHGFDVAASGPIRQEVLDAWARETGGRG